MRQLVAGSGQAPGDSPTGERVGSGGREGSSVLSPLPVLPLAERDRPAQAGGSLEGGTGSPATNLPLGAHQAQLPARCPARHRVVRVIAQPGVVW